MLPIPQLNNLAGASFNAIGLSRTASPVLPIKPLGHNIDSPSSGYSNRDSDPENSGTDLDDVGVINVCD